MHSSSSCSFEFLWVHVSRSKCYLFVITKQKTMTILKEKAWRLKHIFPIYILVILSLFCCFEAIQTPLDCSTMTCFMTLRVETMIKREENLVVLTSVSMPFVLLNGGISYISCWMAMEESSKHNQTKVI